jgi:glycosyltransferase involved in cell wall biosynthesis
MAGDGPELDRLRATAPENVTFLGQVGDDELIGLMQRCAAAIFPSRDDFGLVPLEVMACGRPVLALRAGGALDTIVEGETGAFLSEPTAEGIAAAIESFDPGGFDSARIREHAMRWDRRHFRAELIDAVSEAA